MITFSNAKINIGLRILGKRPDGYHNIETIFYPLPLYDILELTTTKQTDLTILGRHIPGNKENNLILQAYRLLKKDYNLPPIHFYLLKNIPVGAGLGAGSANGAYALKAINTFFTLNIPTNKLLEYALRLGSDCPFFILNTSTIATGRGEILSPIAINLSLYKIAIINPGIHINTGNSFNEMVLKKKEERSLHILPEIRQWKKTVTNDFESLVFRNHNEVECIKDILYHKGSLYASMTGSGSTVYGLFEKNKQLVFDFPKHYYCKIVDL